MSAPFFEVRARADGTRSHTRSELEPFARLIGDSKADRNGSVGEKAQVRVLTKLLGSFAHAFE